MYTVTKYYAKISLDKTIKVNVIIKGVFTSTDNKNLENFNTINIVTVSLLTFNIKQYKKYIILLFLYFY